MTLTQGELFVSVDTNPISTETVPVSPFGEGTLGFIGSTYGPWVNGKEGVVEDLDFQ